MERRWGRAAAVATLLAVIFVGVPLAPAGLSAHPVPHPLRLGEARGLTNGQLAVGISEDPTEGIAPLNVTFTAVASGGTGIYTQYVWKLGDGGRGVGRSIIYTFGAPGTIPVTVNVSDSSGATATARVSVEVVTAGESSQDAGPLATATIAAALVGGSALGGLAGLVAWRRSSRRPDPSVRPPPDVVRSTGAASAAPASPMALTQASFDAAAAPRSPSPRAVSEETLRLSERVILHLARQPALTAYDFGTPERTQSWMTQAFGSSQSAISNLLVRLAAAGVVRGETRHVNGIPRRVKVYELTAYGTQVARELRARTPGEARASAATPSLPPVLSSEEVERQVR